MTQLYKNASVSLQVSGVSVLVTIASWLVATKVAACRFLIALAALANVFNICWFIVGSIDVFGNWSSYNLPNSDDNRLKCDDITYMFSFVLLIIAWVGAPIISILVCGCHCDLQLILG